MGLGTWAWGNQLLWGYQPEMDDELQEVFNTVVAAGVNIFDTADSYGKDDGSSKQQLHACCIRLYPGNDIA
jgi:pyridoxine 4-dehydrogenase